MEKGATCNEHLAATRRIMESEIRKVNRRLCKYVHFQKAQCGVGRYSTSRVDSSFQGSVRTTLLPFSAHSN